MYESNWVCEIVQARVPWEKGSGNIPTKCAPCPLRESHIIVSVWCGTCVCAICDGTTGAG